VPWYQPLAEMQAFSELTGGGPGGLCGFGTQGPGMSRRGSNSICSRLGSATVGPAQVSSSSVSAARTSSKKHLSLQSSTGRLEWVETICPQPPREFPGKSGGR